MTVDITSTPTSYSVHAAVPGLKKEDINITVDDGVLTIEAERKETRGGQKEPTSSSTSSTQSAEEKTGEEKTAGTEGSPSSTASPTTEVDEDVNYHHVESFYGRVTRSIQLPDDARVDELTAKYEDGVIKIEVPRKKEQRKEAKKIQIQ
jgi:HSP20 family molecular chaperone IbpA